MALDPFFQQGMNNWSRSIAARRKQAASLTQLAQTGQVKDLLQQLAHKQKMAEGKQTGQFNLENTFAGHGIAGQKAAEVLGIPMTSATDNVPNALKALRDAGNLQKIGAGAGPLARDTGQYIDNPLGMLQGIGSTFRRGRPGSQITAALGNPAKAEDTQTETFNTIGGDRGLMGKVKITKKRSAKGSDAEKILQLLDQLKGTENEVMSTATDPKTGKSGAIYKVGDKYLFRADDGTIRDVTGER